MIELTPPYADLAFMSPLSDARADRLALFVAAGNPGVVLDLGCGWAELLLRVMSAAPAARGIGIDLDEPAIEHGRSLATARGLSDRVELIAGEVANEAPQTVDAVLCIGATGIWAPVLDDAADYSEPLNYRGALASLRALVPNGGRVVYGDGIWSAPPTPAAIAPLAGRDDEFVTMHELVAVAVESGFMPMAAHEATLDEWDVFESGYAARFARWLAEHSADDPDADTVRTRAERQRAAYYGGYRGILGMAYLELVAV